MFLNYCSFLLSCFLLFLLFHPKVFVKFWVVQCFWRLCHLLASCSPQNWMLFSQGMLLLTFRVSHWALLAAVISKGYQQGGLHVWCELLRFSQPCKLSPWVCWHVNCALLCKCGRQHYLCLLDLQKKNIQHVFLLFSDCSKNPQPGHLQRDCDSIWCCDREKRLGVRQIQWGNFGQLS